MWEQDVLVVGGAVPFPRLWISIMIVWLMNETLSGVCFSTRLKHGGRCSSYQPAFIYSAPYSTACSARLINRPGAILPITSLHSDCPHKDLSFSLSSMTLGEFCLQWCGSVTYGTTAPVRYYPLTALVLLWSSVPCRHRSRPLPSSPGLHSGSSQRLATKNWKTEANLAENGWGWSAPAQLWPGDGKTARYVDRPAWRLLVDDATSSRDREWPVYLLSCGQC